MTVARVLLIRHGETTWNIERRWQGAIHEVPLNETGQAQAQATAEYLKAFPIDSIYSSDLQRAWDTAVTIGKALDISPSPDPRWREVNAGIFQGLTAAEQREQYPEELAKLRDRDSNYRFPGGESWKDVEARTWEALQDIAESASGSVVVIVSHGGAIRSLLRRIFADRPDLANLPLRNTAITTLEYHEHHWHLVEAGATPHLPDAPESSANNQRETPL